MKTVLNKAPSQRKFSTRSFRRLLAVAACAIGFGVMGAAPASADTRCVAQAETAFGTLVRGTRAVETRRAPRRACGIALRRCERKLDHVRDTTHRRMPFARCEVLRRVHVADHRPSQVRCVAEASRRNGRALPATRATEIRHNRHRACAVAMAECNDRLDHLRWRTGRRMPYARCDVIETSRVASANLARPSFSFALRY